MKLFITGTSGFIGYHLAKKILERGDTVVGVDSVTDYYDTRIKEKRNEILKGYKNFVFYKQSITDHSRLREIFEVEKPEVIVHLAAQAGVRYSLKNPWAYSDSNYLGTMNIFECAKEFGIKRVLFASSSSVYGANTKMPFNEDDKTDTPLSIYAASKKANEVLAYSYHHLYNMTTIGLRFFTVYGEFGRPDLALFKFAKNILQDKEIQLYNNGNMTRNFTYVKDIVDGILGIIDNNISGFEIYNLGGTEATSLNRFVELIEYNFGKKAKIKLMPIQAGDVPATIADISKAKRDFGFEPKTSIEEGIKVFVDWFVENKEWLLELDEDKN